MKINLNISESDKKDILDLHKIIKESLNSKITKTKINEQSNQLRGVELLRASKSNQGCKLSFGGTLKSAPGKPTVLYKIADYDSTNGYFVKGDELYIKDDFTFDVVKNKNGVKTISSQNKPWKCDALFQQETDDKKAEELKKTQEQSNLDTEQKAFLTGLTDQGYVIDPLPSKIASERLTPVDLGTIPGLKKYFPNGINVYYNPTGRGKGDASAFKARSEKMVANVKKCKDIIETYWDNFRRGGEGDLTDTLFLDTNKKAQACANRWYPKWEGLEGGVLGVNTGKNRLNDMIDVLTGVKTIYQGKRSPSMSTGWGLKKPPTER